MKPHRILALPLFLAACGQGPSAAPAPTPPLAGARIGGPFALVDGDARPVTDATFRGRYRIMYFGYTFCPDVCPTDVAAIGAGLKLAEAQDAARAAKVVPIFVTVDPARDTPPVVKAFAAAFHPRMVGLTGTPAQVDAIKKAYAVFAQKGAATPSGGYMVDHSRQAYLMGPAGEPLALVPQDEGPKAVAAAIAAYVR